MNIIKITEENKLLRIYSINNVINKCFFCSNKPEYILRKKEDNKLYYDSICDEHFPNFSKIPFTNFRNNFNVCKCGEIDCDDDNNEIGLFD